MTALHDLELIKAIELKEFRNEISKAEVTSVLKRVNEHEAKRICYRLKTDWVRIFSIAIDLSKQHTGKIGSRSLDIIHVACALSIGAKVLLTFHERQRRLAEAAGLQLATRLEALI